MKAVNKVIIERGGFTLGQEVWIYDWHRMMIPVRGIIEEFSEISDAVRLRLVSTNNPMQHPIGSDFLVHEAQISCHGPYVKRDPAASHGPNPKITISAGNLDTLQMRVGHEASKSRTQDASSYTSSPAHAKQVGGTYYKGSKLQPWDVIEAWGLDFWLGNVVKYVFRASQNVKEDPQLNLEKGKHYLEKKLELLDQVSQAGIAAIKEMTK